MKKTFQVITFLLIVALATCYYKQEWVQGFVDKYFPNSGSKDSVQIDTVTIKDEDEMSPSKLRSEAYVKKVLHDGPFKSLDDYAKNTPVKYEKDMDKLVLYLLKPAKSKIEKVRLLFSWMAFHIKYDSEGYNSGDYGDLSPEGVLKRKVAVCSGYSSLFQELCKKAGIEAEEISGYSKGYGYETGVGFNKSNHSWNAIKMSGIWRLFDVTWASGYGQNENGKLVSYREFDDYWFDTDPKEFIFSHFPEESKWQCIDSKISLHQFQELPYIDVSFFKLGFNASYILKNTLNKNITGLVESFPIAFPVKIITFPCSAEIKSKDEMYLILNSEYAEEVVAINNDKWFHFKRNGETFKLKIKPEIGVMEISVKFNKYDHSYSTCLKYKVN